LPLTDRVILEMAISELINFPNIPVKVTINEYIELAKQYSTPKSRQFINGILDVIAKELKDSGKIKKSGRGLMDNK
jgi:N utilization substance protein B